MTKQDAKALLEARAISIQVRTSYACGTWGGYGYVAVVEHKDGTPKWVPIRNTKLVHVLERTSKCYAGTMVRSQLAQALAQAQSDYPKAETFGL